MFVPDRALCPSCTIMKRVEQSQRKDGVILFKLEVHKSGSKDCNGSEKKVVTICEVNYEEFFGEAA